MQFKWHNPGCPCCGCPEYSDDFNRVDNEDPGPNWPLEIEGKTAQIGDWDILDNEFYSELTSNSMAIYKTDLPTNWMIASIKIVDEQLGGIYRVIVSWKDMQNYLYGEYRRVDQNNARLSLHSVILGVNSEIDFTEFELPLSEDQDPATGYRTLIVCVDPNLFVASIDGNSTQCRSMSNGIKIDKGFWAGVGHDNTSFPTKFDDFWMMEEKGEAKKEDCPLCNWCYCEDTLVPFALLATIQGNDDCNTLDGIECTLYGQKCGAGTSWYGVIDDDSCLDGWVMELKCGDGHNDDVSTWELTFSSDSYTPCGASNAPITPEEGGTCSPINLRYCLKFEDISPLCPEGCWPCGDGGPAEWDGKYIDYCIYVTEAP